MFLQEPSDAGFKATFLLYKVLQHGQLLVIRRPSYPPTGGLSNLLSGFFILKRRHCDGAAVDVPPLYGDSTVRVSEK